MTNNNDKQLPEPLDGAETFKQLSEAYRQSFKVLIDNFTSAIMPIIKKLVEFITEAIKPLTSLITDLMLYAANCNPKWWHYYKHSKKLRIRKKYRDKLVREMFAEFERRTK